MQSSFSKADRISPAHLKQIGVPGRLLCPRTRPVTLLCFALLKTAVFNVKSLLCYYVSFVGEIARLAWAAMIFLSGSLALSSDATENSADFLESVVRRMQEDRFVNSGEDFSDYQPAPHPYDLQYTAHDQIQQQDHHQPPSATGDPGPPLTKGELLALYQAVVAKGTGLDLSALPQLPLTPDHHPSNQHHQHSSYEEPIKPSDQGTLPGYYYYFYPITSFLGNNSSETSDNHSMAMGPMMDDNNLPMKDIQVDPLFLAMAGFVSMATLLSFSILFLPKFGDNRSRQKEALKNLPEEDDDMFRLSRVVGQAMQGQDCVDRLACELGRAMYTMNLGQKPIRVLEAMLPARLSKQMTQVRQHMVKKDKCHDILCKPNTKPKPNPNLKAKPKPKPKINQNVKKQTNNPTSH